MKSLTILNLIHLNYSKILFKLEQLQHDKLLNFIDFIYSST